MTIASRTRRVRNSMILPSLAAALVAHGTILGTVHALGVTMIGDGLHAQTSTEPELVEAIDLKASCQGDAILATSGRTALCLAPWIDDVDRCMADAQLAMWMDLSGCQARNDPSTAIAMIDQQVADKLTPIDPERLLDEVVPPPPPEQQPAPPPPQPQIAEAAPPPPPVAAPPPPPPPEQRKQVIETVKPSDEKEPENARFLAEYNTKVEKDKVARGARNEPMVAKSQPEELAPKDKPKDEPSVKKEEPDRIIGKNERAPDVPGHLSMRTPGSPLRAEKEQEQRVRGSTGGSTGAPAADGYTARKGDGAIDQQRRERNEAVGGQSGAGGGAPQAPNLKPTDEVLERAIGGGSVDHLEDVENGDESALSAKKFIYAGFFNRMKRQVAQNWDPATVWRRRDPTGTVFGFKTRVTEVRVSLSRNGDIAKILVTTPSGVVELDDEAVRAFKSAGPFPNPPEALIQKDNLITFGFSFFFEIGAPKIKWRLPQSM
jgi:TonB family protein